MAGRIDELRKRLQAQPASRLFAQLAEELRKDGQLDEAIRVCREGLRQHPAYPSAHMTLGRALFDKGDLGAARDEFESVVSAAPDNILAGRLLGECLEGLGDHGAARKRYETTLLLAPDDAQLAARLEAVRASPATREPLPRRTVPPEGMRRAAAQSVVAAAVASATRSASTESEGSEPPGGRAASEPPASTANGAPSGRPSGPVPESEVAADQQDPGPDHAEDAPATIPFGDPTPAEPAPEAATPAVPGGEGTRSRTSRTLPFGTPAPADPASGRSPTSAEVGTVEAGGAAGAEQPAPEGSGAAPVGSSAALSSEEGGPPGATSRTLPFGMPAPKLPPRPPGRPPQVLRRPETRPVSVDSVRQALAETGPATPAGETGEIATATLAELYLKQGHPEKAADVYRAILERDPDDEESRRRLGELERQQAERGKRRTALEAGIARLERLLAVVQDARRA